MTPLHEKALLVTLNLGLPPNSKMDKRITAEIRHSNRTDKLRASKTLFPDKAIEPIRVAHREAYEFHRTHTVAWSDEGARLLASAHYFDYMAALRNFKETAARLADDFVASYPVYIADARRELGGAFDPSDYPGESTIRGRFKFDVKCIPVPDGGDFRISIQREEMDALRAGVDAQCEAAATAAKNDLAQRLCEPLAAIVNRLQEPEGMFRESLMHNLRVMADLVPVLNITGNAELEAVGQRIKDELYDTDAGLVRENSAVRTATARKAQSILDTMNGFFAAA